MAGLTERQRDEQTDHNARNRTRNHADGKVRKFLVGAVLRAFKLCWHSSMVPAHAAPQERIFASRLETYTGVRLIDHQTHAPYNLPK